MVVEERALVAAETAVDTSIMEKVVVEGDLSKLDPVERLHYYGRLCESLGLNPLTQPFEYLRLNGKLVLYAKKTATDQLRKAHGVSIVDVQHQQMGDTYIVTAHARTRAGIEDVDEGAVNVKGLYGDALANSYMKALTKAKRRVTLSICGLGMLDETEVETIRGATPEPADDWRERERRRFFAVAKGTFYESDEGRAEFIARYSKANGYGQTASLRAFLTAATERDAIALVSALEQATQDGPSVVDVTTGEITEAPARDLADEMFADATENKPMDPSTDAARVSKAEQLREWYRSRVPVKPSAPLNATEQNFQGARLAEITGSISAAGAVLRYLTGDRSKTFAALTEAEAALFDKLAGKASSAETLAAIVPVAKAWAAERVPA